MVLNSVQGRLTEKQIAGFACCEVNGVEWLLAMSEQSLAQLPAIGAEVRIFTQLKVSENSMVLYGFATRQERALFEALVSVSGIGPKVALGMLSKASSEEIAACIIQGDSKELARLPGLGSKTAQKLVLQLGDKLEKRLLLAGVTVSTGAKRKTGSGAEPPAYLQQRREYEDLCAALVAMGYDERRSREVLDELFGFWLSEDADAEEGSEESSPQESSRLPAEGERLRQAILHLGA